MTIDHGNDVKKLYQGWGATMAEHPEMLAPPLDDWRDLIESWPVVTAEPGGVDYVEVDAGGVRAMWVNPHDAAEDRVLLALHGGGFVTGSIYTHRKLFGHIAKAVGARALIVDYRRSPEHVHPAQVDDALTSYEWLLDQGIRPEHIAFTGDSSGGGLAITAQLRARAAGRPVPAAAMPFSPWVDLEATGASMQTNKDKDALLQKEFADALAAMFLGSDGDRKDPFANPLYADLTGLAPLYIQVGGDEVNLDDANQLAAHAEKAGVEVRLDVFDGEQHTFQMAAGRAPKADEAIRRLAEWVRPRLGLS
jgi:acetyl esterase/lipase